MRKIKHLRDVPLSCYWLERIFVVQMLRRKDEPEENGKKGVAMRAGRNMFCSIFVLLMTGVFTEVVVGVQAWHGEHGINVDVSGQRGLVESGAQGWEIEHGACADIKSEKWKRVLIS